MNLFGGVIPVTGISFLLMCVFAILFVGYALGRITIKGVCLGDAGVFVVALIFGALLYAPLEAQLIIKADAGTVNFAEKALEIIESLGLILFVTSVGFIAGPKFFGNLKRNFKSYVLLGLVIILAGGLAAIACILTGRVIGFGAAETSEGFTAMIVGLLSGSLTSTPAFSAAKATVAPELTNLVSVGHGIAYILALSALFSSFRSSRRWLRLTWMLKEQRSLSFLRVKKKRRSLLASFFPSMVTVSQLSPSQLYSVQSLVSSRYRFQVQDSTAHASP